MREMTMQDKYRWIRLEVQCNAAKYPQLVKQGLMTTAEAEYYLAVQHSILNDYERLLEGEPVARQEEETGNPSCGASE